MIGPLKPPTVVTVILDVPELPTGIAAGETGPALKLKSGAAAT